MEVCPVKFENEPAKHEVHWYGVEKVEDHVPALHGVQDVDPLFEKVPGGQIAHTSIDVRSLGKAVVE